MLYIQLYFVLHNIPRLLVIYHMYIMVYAWSVAYLGREDHSTMAIEK